MLTCVKSLKRRNVHTFQILMSNVNSRIQTVYLVCAVHGLKPRGIKVRVPWLA